MPTLKLQFRRIARSPMGQGTIIAFGAALIVLWFVGDNTLLLKILRGAQLGVAVAVSFVFARTFYETLQEPDLRAESLLPAGVFLAWAATALAAAMALIWRVSGRPPWIADSDLVALHIFASTLGGIYHLIAPGAVDGRIPRMEWIKVGCALGCGVFALVMLALFLEPPAPQWVQLPPELPPPVFNDPP